MAGISVPVGIKNAQFRAGLDEMRGQARRFAGDIKGEFLGSFSGIKGQIVGAFGLGALASSIGGLLEKGGQIQDLSERFDATAESLQRIGNVAAQNGSSLESVGAALNKTALSQEAARKGSIEHQAALDTLKIGTEEFINLSAEEAFYRIADATRDAEDRQAAYDAVIKLMGKSSGELFTTLEMGGDAIRELGESIGVYSDESIARLDEMGDALDAAKNRFAVSAGSSLLWIDKMARSAGAIGGGMFAEVARLWGGAGDNGAAAAMVDEIWNPSEKSDDTKKPRRERDQDAAKNREGDKAANNRKKLEEDIARLQEEARTRGMDDETRLAELVGKRVWLENTSGNDLLRATDAELQARKEALEVAAEIAELEKKMADDRMRAATKEQELRDKAAKDLQDSLLEEKRLAEEDALQKMSPAQQREALTKKRDELYRASQLADQNGMELEASQYRLQARELQRRIDGIADPEKPADPGHAPVARVSVDSLTAVGGGGGVGSGLGDPQLRELQNHGRTLGLILRSLEDANRTRPTSRPTIK